MPLHPDTKTQPAGVEGTYYTFGGPDATVSLQALRSALVKVVDRCIGESNKVPGTREQGTAGSVILKTEAGKQFGIVAGGIVDIEG